MAKKDFLTVIVGVLFFTAIIGAYVSGINQPITRTAVINETVQNLTNTTTRSLANDNIVSGTVTLLNFSTNVTIPATNYTVDLTAGTIILDGVANDYEGENAKISYTVEADIIGVSAILIALIILIVVLGFLRREVIPTVKSGR